MILCLDAGNTRLKLGLHDGRHWCFQHTLVSAEVRADPAGAAAAVMAALPAPPKRVVACSVAGGEIETAIAGIAARFGLEVDWLRSSAAALGVRNGYAQPAQLGSDRWAALLAARALHNDACVVVMAGTATTIDALDADGRFRGGLILPGLTLMRQVLAGATAQLPLAEGDFRHWPDNTDDAIGSGAIAATLGAIAGLRAQLAAGAVPCLLAGGAAPALAPHLPAPLQTVQTLVLDGLLRHALAT